ncbi:hypothetical protein RvY_10627-1 [Ramazzottius varieornatus]|uniref:Kazal-like domain-containing protein n=1 Tax=Ramazzottius varieornatus TaxID=947166 RepID=A0A1D1VDD4_RAMVA|nr:hypothetical protein RvY_10627-1 [Ramazzottius varieornatus]
MVRLVSPMQSNFRVLTYGFLDRVSAWYLGFIVTGLGMCISTLTMMCFPSSVPESTSKQFEVQKDSNKAKITDEPVTIRDLPRNLKKILTNAPLMARIFCKVFTALVVSGYFNFLPKFLAAQYFLSPRTASMASGLSGVAALSVGIIAGSVVIKKFRLQPKHISLMLIGSAIAFSTAHFIALSLDCKQVQLEGNWDTRSHSNASCGASCACNRKDFAPVCDTSSSVSYFSPCHAGCARSSILNGTRQYMDCKCLSTDNGTELLKENLADAEYSGVTAGFCRTLCTNFYVYMTVMFILKAIGAFPLSGTIMLTFRLVEPELKSMANAVSALLMSAFGYFPAPILMGKLSRRYRYMVPTVFVFTGAIIDSTCILWKERACGEKGSCLLYDTDQFRFRMHFAVGVCKLLVLLLEIYVSEILRHIQLITENSDRGFRFLLQVFFKVKNLRFEDEDDDGDDEVKDRAKTAEIEMGTTPKISGNPQSLPSTRTITK